MNEVSQNALYFLKGGGEMGEFMRNKDWSKTPLGSPNDWPQSLKTSLSIVLNCKFPMFIFWGSEQYCFYNDAYRPSLGQDGKHPSILGMAGKEAWPEIWDEIYPMITNVLYQREAIYNEDMLIPIFRNGKMQDVYWTFSYSPIVEESGEVAGVMVVCTETTETVLFTKRLTESEQRFRDLADHAPMWIWMTDPDINMEYVNKKLLEFLGIKDSREFTGQIWKEKIHPDDVETVYQAFELAVTQQSEFYFEVRVRNAKTQEYEWFYIEGVPRLMQDKLVGFIGTGMSIEKQKYFTQQLAKEVEKRTKELASTVAELGKANEELQSFNYISSHDLQEPLRKIQTFCSLLEISEAEQLSESGKDKFRRIQSSASRMQSLINDMLAYCSTDNNENFETCNLEDHINEVLEDLSEEIVNKDAEIEVDANCEVHVVPFQFRQLLLNLLGNAIKYCKPDVPPNVKISSSIVNGSHKNLPELDNAKQYCKITVQDNGIGFSNENAERIFDLFQRLHTRSTYQGSGIGLAIVKKIVNNHKGTIKATSTLGQGSTFEVFIPKHS